MNLLNEEVGFKKGSKVRDSFGNVGPILDICPAEDGRDNYYINISCSGEIRSCKKEELVLIED